eukprot:scaffold3803_cov151-Skeletonema_menzelii.AAC.3
MGSGETGGGEDSQFAGERTRAVPRSETMNPPRRHHQHSAVQTTRPASTQIVPVAVGQKTN